MENLPYIVGSLLPLVLFGCLPAYFLDRAFRVSTRSARLANLSLACGLSVVILGEFVFVTPETNWMLRLTIGSLVRGALAITGIGLAIAALFARGDGGVSVARPVWGIFFSGVHLLFAGLMILMMLLNNPGMSWEFVAQDKSYSLTLPSTAWREVPPSPKLRQAAFARRSPPAGVQVMAVRKGQSRADMEEADTSFGEQIKSKPADYTQMNFREGKNAAGHPYRYVTLIDKSSGSGSLFIAHSVTLNEETGVMVVLFFEGPLRMSSQAGQSLELQKMKAAADTICLSVK